MLSIHCVVWILKHVEKLICHIFSTSAYHCLDFLLSEKNKKKYKSNHLFWCSEGREANLGKKFRHKKVGATRKSLIVLTE